MISAWIAWMSIGIARSAAPVLRDRIATVGLRRRNLGLLRHLFLLL